MTRQAYRECLNPYRQAFTRGFWYGLISGAALIGIAWRLFA